MSLGTGNTMRVKREFKEQVYKQARVGVKQYHSDNSMFKPKIFTESYKEGGQSECFSGVEYQPQIKLSE